MDMLDLEMIIDDKGKWLQIQDQINTHATCVVNSRQSGKGCWSSILTKLLNSSTFSSIGCNTSSLMVELFSILQR